VEEEEEEEEEEGGGKEVSVNVIISPTLGYTACEGRDGLIVENGCAGKKDKSISSIKTIARDDKCIQKNQFF